jgi:hypothetical protein
VSDDATRKASDTTNPIPRWTEWLTLGLAASAWGSFCLWFATKLLEDAYGTTWGRALRRSDAALVFIMAGPMFAFASLASYLALRRVGRHTRRNTLGLLVGFGFLLGFAVLTCPWPHGARERARRTLCTSRLKQIRYACDLYAKDNADAFPPELVHLFRDYITDPQLFVCPTVANEGHVPNLRSGPFLPEAVCYGYVTGLRATDDGDFVLAFDEEWNHGRRGIVFVRIGGQVGWASDIELFHADLEKQRAPLAAEGRNMRFIRPTWSRWPEAPEYPVHPWHERPWMVTLVVIMALAAAGGVMALVAKRRRAIRAASAGGSGGSPSGGC